MNDEQANAFYADPANQVPAPGSVQRRPKGTMNTHVPIRFRPEIIARVKHLAALDRKTVSSWIRDLVETEVERREPHYPTSRSQPILQVDTKGFDSWTTALTTSGSGR
jgi:hypothetical protein